MIIAIDGIDGAGKGTQAKKLQKYFLFKDLPCKLISFPIYDSIFGKMISEYLNGEYGSLYSVNPKLPSLLYAQDRNLFFSNFAYKPDEILIIDRYVNSNLAHQGSKLHSEKRRQIMNWILELEYKVNKIPRPDVSFILDLEIENSIKNVTKKKKRSYTELTHDLHESNYDYLKESRNVFLSLANNDKTHLIKCDLHGELRKQENILNEIISIIKKEYNLL